MSVGGSLPPPPNQGGQPPAPPAPPSTRPPSGSTPPPPPPPPTQQSPLPPADYSAGFARTFQQPSFYNPFQGYYGSGMPYGSGGGGFASFGSGFGGGFGGGYSPPPIMALFGGNFGGGFGNSFSGGYSPPPMMPPFGRGFNQPSYGGFNQPSYGGFSPPPMGPQATSRQGNAYTRPMPPTPPAQPPQVAPPPTPNPNDMVLGAQAIIPTEGGYYTDLTQRNFVPNQPSTGKPSYNPLAGSSGDTMFIGGTPGFYDNPMNMGIGGFGRIVGSGQSAAPRSPTPNRGGSGDTMYIGGTPGFYDNPMNMGLGSIGGGGNQQPQPQMAERYNPNIYDPRADAQRKMQQQAYDREANTTDYQKLMARKNMAGSGPYVNPLTGAVGGVNPFTQVSDVEIAASLGWKDPIADPNRMTDMAVRPRLPGQEEAERTANNAKAKAYLDSIGYGKQGFDASKYEVRRERSPSVGFSEFGGLFSGLR